MVTRPIQALNFFQQRLGLTPVQAAGFVGNLQQESGQGLDPTIIGDQGRSFGIAQFLGPRRRALGEFAEERGTDPGDFQTQLEFIAHEFGTTERGALEAIKAAQTPEEAARAGVKFFRPSDPRTENRIRNAQRLLGQTPGVEVVPTGGTPEQARGLLAEFGGEDMADEPQGLLAQAAGPGGFLSSSFLSNLGAGILAANAEGRPLGAAIGQGLLQANAGQRERLQNDLLRQRLVQSQRGQQNAQRLQGLLAEGADLQSPEVLGLLAQTNPEAFSQAILGQAFPDERSEPADIRTMDALGIPRTPEGFQAFQEFKAGGSGEQLDQAIKLLQFDKLQREKETEQKSLTQERAATRDTLGKTVTNLKELADLNDRLAGTALQTGVPLNDIRRSVISGGSAALRALGISGGEAGGQIVADFDRFDKLANDFIVQLINQMPGTTSNQRQELLQRSTVSTGAAPDANRRIIADLLEQTFQAAEREGFEIPNREEGEELIRRLRGVEEGEAPQGTAAPRQPAQTTRGRAADGAENTPPVPRSFAPNDPDRENLWRFLRPEDRRLFR